MGSSRKWIASAVVGGLVLVCVSSPAAAQHEQIVRVASLMSGSIVGLVQDEHGAPIPGVLVSAVGVTKAVAYTDRLGRFELRTLAPGHYLVRAHLTGFVAPRAQSIEVHPSARTASSIALHRAIDLSESPKPAPPTVQPLPAVAPDKVAPVAKPSMPIVTASVLDLPDVTAPPPASDDKPDSAQRSDPATPDTGTKSTNDDQGEVAWRLRYARRGVLKDLTLPGSLGEMPPADPAGIFGTNEFARADASHMATNLLAGVPLTGQVNLLTTSSFDSPDQLFSGDSLSRSIAYMSLVAPAGEHSDWSMRGALTQGDLSSWFLEAAYTTRRPAQHQYDFGFLYSTQRYEGGNPAALREITDGNRNVGVVSGGDTLALSPNVSMSYNARYARYGYLTGHGLISPSVALSFLALDGVRVNARVSSEALAPGAEEFLPPSEGGLWLPPQRTFSTLTPDSTLQPERTTSFSVEAERNIDEASTSTVSVRVFRQNVSDQMVTMFGVQTTDAPNSEIGHYFVGTPGGLEALGWSVAFRSTAFARVRGSVEYSDTQANWTQGGDAAYMLLVAPLAVRPLADRVQDLSTSVETNVPETATRVLVVCRLSNLHAAGEGDRPLYSSRFDVQVRQSLPFMDFGGAKWEMLLAVRNFFRDPSQDSSVYDEILVVHPPKRIVGGLTVRF